jgi:DNA (cytosine-5)-methyltransferase 1
LFSGYGGLDMAVGGDLAWYSEIEPAACRVMEAHHCGVPNIGDVTRVDWSEVEPVDVLTGGYPCQPFSTAGKRLGEDDDRHLWPCVRDAISVLEPGIAVLENVAGHLSLGFGTVMGELSELGYSARWGVVRAADAGAPHNRRRLFVVDYSQSAEWGDTKSELVGSGKRSAEFGEFPSTFDFGEWKSAVAKWSRIVGRAAPIPYVIVGDKRKVSSFFVEWMMGLPEGWVTGHGLSLSQELKLLGNGVVPQQARLALELL